MNPAIKNRILVAEDNAVNVKLIMQILKKFKLEADIAETGIDVLATLAGREYDMILMDVKMPEMDGIEATREIRKRSSHPFRPVVIAMTASAMKGDMEACILAGMNDYLSKPVIIRDLKSKLEIWLGCTRQTDGMAHDEEGSFQDCLDKERLDLLKTLEMDRGELAEMLRLFASECSKRVLEMEQAALSEDWNRLKYIAHDLKGSALNYGATKLSERSHGIEELLTIGNYSSIPDALSEIKSALRETIEGLCSYLDYVFRESST